eukprot:TRINITY_DN4847_c0_g1_i1.p1 TRINITY_DN4847_c0_g1~~TRINITY_DN4847_c0_g1_i1.p1  ORF type:complete len:729 (-),score=452.45 TRINITY_DN4847_c0_g1_i1:169-2316(-)
MKNKQKQKQAVWISNTRQKKELEQTKNKSKTASKKPQEVDHFADDDQELFNRDLEASDSDDDLHDSDDDIDQDDDDILPLDVGSYSDDSSDEEEDEEDEEINEILGKRSKTEKKIDDVSDKAWGAEKKRFYDRDVNIDNDDKINRRKKKALREKEEDYAKEEEQEAIRLQKEKAKAFRAEDFEDDDEDEDETENTIGSLVKSKKGKSADFNDLSDEEEKDVLNDGLDDIQDSEERLALKRERLAKMSPEEKIELVKRDSPELINLLGEYKSNISLIREKIAPILDLANKRKSLENLKGISFLELKYHLLLNYCTNISFYLLMKAEGRSIKDHPVVEALIRNRTVLEKMKPLDSKLKYQIDKLLKLASSGNPSEKDIQDVAAEFGDADALSFRPSLENFELDMGSKKKGSKDDAYVPPKLAASHFEETGYKKKDKREQKAVKSSIAKFLKSTFSSEPEMLDASGAGIEYSRRREEDLEAKEHEALEEENFFRVNMPKKTTKKVRKESDLAREFSHLEDFSDLAVLDRQKDDDGEIENYRKEKALKKALESIGSDSKKRKQLGGDEDVPYPVQQKLYQNKRKYEAEGDDDMSNKNRKVNLSDEDEMYQAQAKKLNQRKANKKKDTGPKIIPKQERTIKEGDKRKITYDIKANKGLTPYRKKESRNSRVKLRGKFEKANRKLTGAGHKSGPSGVALTPYSGENRIKANVAHSISMRDS